MPGYDEDLDGERDTKSAGSVGISFSVNSCLGARDLRTVNVAANGTCKHGIV